MRYEIRQGQAFSKWFGKIKDKSIRIKILARLARVENGNLGDHKKYLQTFLSSGFILGQGIEYTILFKMTL